MLAAAKMPTPTRARPGERDVTVAEPDEFEDTPPTSRPDYPCNPQLPRTSRFQRSLASVSVREPVVRCDDDARLYYTRRR